MAQFCVLREREYPSSSSKDLESLCNKLDLFWDSCEIPDCYILFEEESCFGFFHITDI